MAKKKAAPKAAPAREQRIRTAVLNIRSMQDWKDWVIAFAEAQRKDVPDLVDEALLRMAKSEGYKLPPKR